MRFIVPERRHRLSFWLVTLLTLLISAAWAKAGLADEEGLRERIGGVRIPFIANRGQTDPAVAKQLTGDMKRDDAAAAHRATAIDADVDGPCVHETAVRDVLMTMPTL